MEKDGFNPELSEKFAQFIGEMVSKNAENFYRLGIAYRNTNPILSKIYMLSFFYLTGRKLSANFN